MGIGVKLSGAGALAVGSGLYFDGAGNLVVGTSPNPGNLVTNGDFELLDTSSSPVGWTLAGSIGRTTAAPLSGSWCIRGFASSPGTATCTMIVCAVSQIYYAQFWLRGTGTGPTGSMVVNFLDSSQALISTTTLVASTAGTSTWTAYGAQFTVPSGCNYFTIEISLAATSGSAYADVVSVVNAIVNPYIVAGAVLAQNTSIAAINASTGALAAQAAVINLQQNGGSLTVNNGINVFTGAMYLSQGTTEPVIALLNSGIFLYGVAGSGNTGLTADPYVAIQSSGIGVFSGGTGPSVTVGGSNVTLWSVNGSTGTPYMQLTASQLQIINGSTTLTVNFTFIEFQDASGGILLMNSGGISIFKGASSIGIGASFISIVQGQLTLNWNSTTVSIDNSLDGVTGNYAGVKVLDNSTTNYAVVTGFGFAGIDAGGVSRAALTVSGSGGSSAGAVNLNSAGGGSAVLTGTGPKLLMNGSKVIGPRGTDPGAPLFTTLADAQTYCAALRTQLAAATGGHGLF